MTNTIAQRKVRAIEKLTNNRDAAIQRAEDAEARAAQAEQERDVYKARSLSAENLWHLTETERDEARRQLTEAQTAIDAMAQIVGAADEVKHQLIQAQSDIEDYRAEIARLHQAATA